MPVVEADRGMGPVAERLVVRLAAPTEGLPVPLLVREAVGRFHLDAPSYRQRTRAPLGRILDDADRGFVVLLERTLCLSVPRDQSS